MILCENGRFESRCKSGSVHLFTDVKFGRSNPYTCNDSPRPASVGCKRVDGLSMLAHCFSNNPYKDSMCRIQAYNSVYKSSCTGINYLQYNFTCYNSQYNAIKKIKDIIFKLSSSKQCSLIHLGPLVWEWPIYWQCSWGVGKNDLF